MSKNFKATYTVDLTNADTIEEFDLAHIVGKLNASELTVDDVSTLIVNKMTDVIEQNDADGILVYADGTCDLVDVDEILEQTADSLVQLENTVDNVESFTKKKEPWYKRLWNKIFGKKNK